MFSAIVLCNHSPNLINCPACGVPFSPQTHHFLLWFPDSFPFDPSCQADSSPAQSRCWKITGYLVRILLLYHRFHSVIACNRQSPQLVWSAQLLFFFEREHGLLRHSWYCSQERAVRPTVRPGQAASIPFPFHSELVRLSLGFFDL